MPWGFQRPRTANATDAGPAGAVSVSSWRPGRRRKPATVREMRQREPPRLTAIVVLPARRQAQRPQLCLRRLTVTSAAVDAVVAGRDDVHR